MEQWLMEHSEMLHLDFQTYTFWFHLYAIGLKITILPVKGPTWMQQKNSEEDERWNVLFYIQILQQLLNNVQNMQITLHLLNRTYFCICDKYNSV